MAPENYAINAPNNWAKAISIITTADDAIDPREEPQAQKRLDDLKQFWYFYYLIESGQGKATSHALKEFVWKGQMSYMIAMYAITKRIFQTNNARAAAGPEFNAGPAHFTLEETEKWWTQVRNFWKVTPVTDFADAILHDGRRGQNVDVNDLVRVAEFSAAQKSAPKERMFLYNSASHTATFLTVASQADEEIGFHLFWPWNPADSHYRDKEVSYGIHRWDTAAQTWQELVDITMTSIHSMPVQGAGGKTYQLVTARYRVPEGGTYRIGIGRGGNVARLAMLDYDLFHGKSSNSTIQPHTYFEPRTGLPQTPVYMYIPKNTKSFDLEVWDTWGKKTLTLYNRLPATGLQATRKVDVSARGTHTLSHWSRVKMAHL